MSFRSAARPATALLALAALAGCARPSAEVAPPAAEFLVATADSTYWVRSNASGIHVRAVPMTIAQFGGRFHEVYVADVDRSFDDAVFTGERVYVRDIVTGDSSMVYDDTAVVTLATRHARTHPDAVPLGPDDDTPTDPLVTATGETDLLEVRGPYVLLEHRSAFEHEGGSQHDTVRTAVDLRTGRPASPETMARDAASLDSSVIRTVPRSVTRPGYTLLARGDSTHGNVSFTLRDGASRSWPLFTVSAHPRVYWLDAPPLDSPTRHALAHAFNDAAAYDEQVKYAAFHGLHGVRGAYGLHAVHAARRQHQHLHPVLRAS